jgi:hypothetical protein
MNPYISNEQFQGILDPDDLLEGRFENDGDGNPLYVGYTTIPDADPDDSVWYIQKIEYVGTGIVRKRLPVDNVGFKYSWTDRATYFS